MSNFAEELEYILNTKGIKKINTEFTKNDEGLIGLKNSFFESVFSNIRKEIKSYINLTTLMNKKPNKYNNSIQIYEIELKYVEDTKLIYRINFIKENDEILVIGEYSVTNEYSENDYYNPSKLRKSLKSISQDDINNDFITVLSNSLIKP